MIERLKGKSPKLGRAGVVKSLIRQGRIPTCSEPIVLIDDGKPKKIVQWTIPGAKGEGPSVVFMPLGSSTQVKRTVEQALRDA